METLKIGSRIAMIVIVICGIWASYNAGKQSILQRLSADRIEVLKDGQKIDAAVYAADNDGLVCMLVNCDN